jgi:hypothetical protein
MTRRDPLNGSGPRSERKLRVAGEHSLSRSDAGRASPTSPSSPSPSKLTAFATFLDGTALTVVLTALGRSRFDALFDGVQIVKASKNPISDAARVLHRMGYPDHLSLVAQHEGAAHYAMRGPLGSWRKVRIREDRALRYVAWEPLPCRVGKGHSKSDDVGKGAEKKKASATTPGANTEQSIAMERPARSLRGRP